jgi:oligoribonuclease NrnB/cAMP/cGMP phosphodiesterase (DHH superfamily)
MKCFYHNDLDGHCSAAIIAKFYKEYGLPFKDQDFFETSYDRDFPFDKIKNGEKVYIVDYSLRDNNEWKQLNQITSDIVWIDHHISALEKFGHLDLSGIRKDGIAACELVWEYFFKNRSTPFSVKLLGDYDVWTFKYKDKTNLFQNAMRSYETLPTNDIWKDLLNSDDVDFYLKEGESISRYMKKQYEETVKNKGFEIDFEGKKAIACNASERGSQLFDSVYDESKHDIMIPFAFNGKKWTFSLYSTKDNVDCSKIAAKFGGGGHKKAAGFICKKLPF